MHKESYFRINVCWDIINVQRKQQRTKDSALWDARQNRGPNPILHRLQQLAVVCSTKKNLSISGTSEIYATRATYWTFL